MNLEHIVIDATEVMGAFVDRVGTVERLPDGRWSFEGWAISGIPDGLCAIDHPLSDRSWAGRMVAALDATRANESKPR